MASRPTGKDQIAARVPCTSRCSLHPETSRTPKQAGREVRQTFYGVYRILYTIEANTVVVLTVRHGAQRPTGPTEVKEID